MNAWRNRRHRRDDERGEALVLALIFLLMFSLVIAAILAGVGTNFSMTGVTRAQAQLRYAADAGIEWGLKAEQQASTLCGNNGSFAVVPGSDANGNAPISVSDGPNSTVQVSVRCLPVSGLSANTFGGYAAITGINYPAAPGYPGSGSGAQEYAGSNKCVSISADPVGAGSPTYAKTVGGTTNKPPFCLTYPTGTGAQPPTWFDSLFQVGTKVPQLNAAFAADGADVWAVGNHWGGTNRENLFWFDGEDEWNDLSATAAPAGKTNANLYGVWAVDTNNVWVVGQAGTILYCSSYCDGSGPSTWVDQSTGANTLYAVYGTDASHLWAVGANGTILTCTANCTTGGATWQAPTEPPTGLPNPLSGVYADGNGDVWAVGQTVIATCSQSCNTTAATWTKVASVPGGIGNFTGISGTDSSHLWASAGSAVVTCTANCTAPTGTWAAQTIPGGVALQDIVAADASDVWAVGATGGAGTVIYCNGSSCNQASGYSWTTQAIDVSEQGLFDVAAVPVSKLAPPPPGGLPWVGAVWAVGVDAGTVTQTGWVAYAPGISTGNILATIKGGPVLNGQGVNFATGLQLLGGNFDQYYQGAARSWCPHGPIPNLTVTPFQVNCRTDIPPAVQNLDQPLPSLQAGSPFACIKSGNCADMGAAPYTKVTGDPTCPSYKVYAPGYYKTAPKFSSGATTYFESGVYYFNTGNWGGIGADGKPPPYLIGGVPAPGDLESEATSNPPYAQSPCWHIIQSVGDNVVNGSPYTNNGKSWYDGGTGAEWILAGTTWLDIHTVDIELFTREAPQSHVVNGVADEGAQGLSVREIPPACSGSPSVGIDGGMHPGPYCVSTSSGWNPTVGAGVDQPVQIDANKHNPFVYLHGRVYMPDADMVMFTNKNGVWSGAIDVNSLEMTYMSTTSPPLQIIAGGPNKVQVELVSTATDSDGATVTQEAVATLDYTGTGKAPTVQSWRQCNSGVDPTTGACSSPG